MVLWGSAWHFRIVGYLEVLEEYSGCSGWAAKEARRYSPFVAHEVDDVAERAALEVRADKPAQRRLSATP
jgi:hypothetical protein